MARLSSCLRYGMIDIEADGCRLREIMRLWFQDYSEARVISKVMVEFQETGDINADAEDPAYGNLNRDVEADGQREANVHPVPRLQVKCRIQTPGLGLELDRH
ncbi:Sodium-Dependent Multivitamin Transporter [Manis pentadactyla]|nr:Sodium-Dependent Multivitamin Transporter [Manis pentadactyla]